MNAAAILTHVLSIAHGIGASLACAACFSIAGLVLVPRRWDGSLGHGESAAVLGAALYVLVAWFGIIFGIPLTRLSVGFMSVVLLLAAARYRWCLDATRARTGQATVGWVLAFSVLYVLAYLFTMPPATADYLPPAWTGNVDLLTYARYTRYLQLVGPLGLSGGFPQVNGGEYLQTPAAFSLLGWFSLFFGQDPLSAVMPAQFALTALIGVLVARISRSVFLVPSALALLIGCVVVSGPFFRYVAGAYFLSTLMSMPILLYLLWKTVSCRSQRLVDAGAVIQFGSAYVLLLFIYPLLLLAALAAQTGAIVLMLVAEMQSRGGGLDWRESVRHAARTACAVLVPLGLLVLCLSERVMWSIGALEDLARKGFAGWPLDIISPLAVLGLPGMAADHGHIELTNPTSRVWALAAFCAIALALGFLYLLAVPAADDPGAADVGGTGKRGVPPIRRVFPPPRTLLSAVEVRLVFDPAVVLCRVCRRVAGASTDRRLRSRDRHGRGSSPHRRACGRRGCGAGRREPAGPRAKRGTARPISRDAAQHRPWWTSFRSSGRWW